MKPPDELGSLEGARVLDLTRLLPGPYCTLILADLGARVDKLEEPGTGDYLRHMPPSRDGVSGMFRALNRDKRSICIDLKKPEGPALVTRLARHYDVLVEGFRPGVLERLGLGPRALAEANPRLVVCSITGYGQSGELSQRAGHDINYLARAGVLGLTGPTLGAPQVFGVQLADIAGGALWGAIGILSALLERERTGRGRHVDVSMTDGAHAFLTAALGNHFAGGTSARGAEPLTGGLAVYRVYETMDGKFISVGALEPKFWAGLSEALGLETDFAALVPGPHQAALQEKLAAIFRTRTRDEWMAILASRDTCCEPVLSLAETLNDPHLRSRGLVEGQDVLTPFGPRGTTHRPAPAIGQHTDEILAECGIEPDRIAELRTHRIVV